MVLVYNYLSPHNAEIRVATKDRLQDKSLLSMADMMLDLVFWEKKLFDCEVNQKAVRQFKKYAQEKGEWFSIGFEVYYA